MNCWVELAAKPGFAGVTAMETRLGGGGAVGTVRVAAPETPLSAAVIVVEPCATAFARPALLMVATVVAELVHVAVAVTFCVEPSLYVAVAVNCCVEPAFTVGLAGVTAMETSVAAGGAGTVSVVEPEEPPKVAVMVAEPWATAVACPELLMVATAAAELVHVAVEVTFCVEPSL